MQRIYTSVDQIIGNTPLMELTHIEKKHNLNTKILAKLEAMNPTGSAKDRAAKKMIEDAEEKGLLKPGAAIIEPTSGNTGIGLAAVGVAKGYKVIIVMPDTMSVERIKLIKAYGAEIILSDGKFGMAGAIAKAEELAKENPGSFIPNQFTNHANAKAHYETTGPEIWRDTDGKVDILIATIGTGGTITGTAQYLKEKNPNIYVVGIEPASSPLITSGKAGAHKIQGIGTNFIPEILNLKLIDEVMPITDDQAYIYGREIGNTEGMLVGISSGAAICAAIQLAKKEENKNKNIIVILPDAGSRYLSTENYYE